MKPTQQWWALISVPVEAKTKRGAWMRANAYANSLTHPGSAVIAGHVEACVLVEDAPDDEGPRDSGIRWTKADRLALAEDAIRRWTAFRDAGGAVPADLDTPCT